jgi:Zn-finger protein
MNTDTNWTYEREGAKEMIARLEEEIQNSTSKQDRINKQEEIQRLQS